MKESEQIKRQLISHLQGGEAFVPIEELLKFIPYDELGKRPGNLPYSFYEVFYHIWFAQKDILDYCLSKEYHIPNWPDDYWPAENSPKNEQSWTALQHQYFEERDNFSKYIKDPGTDLLVPLSNGKKHNLLREILLVTEHTAYHTGQLVVILRELGFYGNNRKVNETDGINF